MVDGVTGYSTARGGRRGLIAAIERFESLEFVDGDLRSNAERFRPERFTRELSRVLNAACS